MIRPEYKEFLRLSRGATLVPVAKSISADLLTPVSAFLAVADGEPDAFLLESVEGGEKVGRYTFLGVRPFLRLESRGAEITIERSAVKKTERRAGNVFAVIKELLQQHRPAAWKACRRSPPEQLAIAHMTLSAAWKTSGSMLPTNSTFPIVC